MTPTPCKCANCCKAIAHDKVQRIAIETEGKPAEIVTLCPKCGTRFARNVVRLERAQGLVGVLKA